MKDLLGSVNFILRKDSIKANGKAVLMLSYSLKGHRTRLSLERAYKKDLSIHPYLFNSKLNKAIYYTKKEAKEVYFKYAPDFPFDYDKDFMLKSEVDNYNFKLEEVISIVRKAEQHCKLSDEKYSSIDVIEKVKEILKGTTQEIVSEKKVYIVDYIKTELASQIQITNKGTLKNKTTMLNHVVNFEKESNYRTELKNIDRKYIMQFYNWLITIGQINSTANTQIVKLKSFLNQAKKDGLEVNLTYKDFTVKNDDLEVIALDFNEFKRIRDIDLSIQKFYEFDTLKDATKIGYKTLERTRDIFLFGCYTGLRFSDLMSLKAENIKDDYIVLSIKKTKQKHEIPLIKPAIDIIEKYTSPLSTLPQISNQKFNQYIKLVCELAKINENIEIVRYKGATAIKNVYKKYELISAHTSRKTFITVSLELGMATEEVMHISGHTSYKSFKRYVNISKERAKKVMEDKWK